MGKRENERIRIAHGQEIVVADDAVIVDGPPAVIGQRVIEPGITNRHEIQLPLRGCSKIPDPCRSSHPARMIADSLIELVLLGLPLRLPKLLLQQQPLASGHR
jgi:hypothetical protein